MDLLHALPRYGPVSSDREPVAHAVNGRVGTMKDTLRITDMSMRQLGLSLQAQFVRFLKKAAQRLADGELGFGRPGLRGLLTMASSRRPWMRAYLRPRSLLAASIRAG